MVYTDTPHTKRHLFYCVFELLLVSRNMLVYQSLNNSLYWVCTKYFHLTNKLSSVLRNQVSKFYSGLSNWIQVSSSNMIMTPLWVCDAFGKYAKKGIVARVHAQEYKGLVIIPWVLSITTKALPATDMSLNRNMPRHRGTVTFKTLNDTLSLH